MCGTKGAFYTLQKLRFNKCKQHSQGQNHSKSTSNILYHNFPKCSSILLPQSIFDVWPTTCWIRHKEKNIWTFWTKNLTKTYMPLCSTKKLNRCLAALDRNYIRLGSLCLVILSGFAMSGSHCSPLVLGSPILQGVYREIATPPQEGPLLLL